MKVGAICTGYGGLERALDMAGVPHTLEWVSEISEPANQVLAARFPTVPNIGDINNANPTEVDLITAGFPCQDLSTAGRRAGLDGERSGLWWRIADVISDLRHRYVVLENVAAISSLGGTAVVGSLTGMGYDCRWVTVRASDVGACHQRARWFCLAVSDASCDEGGFVDGERREIVADTVGGGWYGWPRTEGRGPQRRDVTAGPSEDLHLLTTPTSWLGRRPSHSEIGTRNSMSGTGNELVRDVSALLPTPTGPGGSNKSPSPGAARRPQLGQINKLLPTLTASDSRSPGGGYNGQTNVTLTDAAVRQSERFGKYADAIDRHAEMIGRAAPDPTSDGRLNPVFVEWMMGLPAGWVTDVVTNRAAALRTLGNGVVPQQAAAALQMLTSHDVNTKAQRP